MYNTIELIEDKFWIVESRIGKVGTIRKVSTGYEFFNQLDKTTTNIDNLNDFGSIEKQETDLKTCQGYPTNSNIVYNGEHEKLPIFYKKPSMKQPHAAGYYIIKFKKWLPSFCPRLSTLQNYEYNGPFLTEWDMNLQLKRIKKYD